MALPSSLSYSTVKSTPPYLSSAFLNQPQTLPATYKSTNRRFSKLTTSFRCSSSSFSEKHHNNANPPKSDDLIFEYRYRVMMQTLLQSDLRFGVVYSDAASGSAAGVGCVGEIVKHERLVDDRFFLICKGQERFRVTDLVRTKPYLVAKVTWLEDRPSGEENLDELANEVEVLMKEVIRLSNRLNGKAAEEKMESSRDLRKNQFPTPFSFFVGSTFEGAPMEQQAETLRNTLNYLTAASAVKDVFPST
ncbi:hypothetical protein Bca52824_031987 [Brassica carinata]|uniref:Lon N-terminal domain-containing protein n=1 Tax=Brassica carinata TaxID=52824 RepID=A0A8X7V884_BRACI|nr:hypothetical protein Bca52824_031987 [Brassica carinata]